MSAGTEPLAAPTDPDEKSEEFEGQPTQEELATEVERLGVRIEAHLEELRRK